MPDHILLNAYLRPLVKVHPETGRKSLFVASHGFGIPGLSPLESEKLMDDLVDFACQEPRTYKHSWRPGDLVVWDNRCFLHRARPYDRRTETRVLRGSRVAGEEETEASLPAAGNGRAELWAALLRVRDREEWKDAPNRLR